jgi:hypothetical protein
MLEGGNGSLSPDGGGCQMPTANTTRPSSLPRCPPLSSPRRPLTTLVMWPAGTDYECTRLLDLTAGLDARANVLRASPLAPALAPETSTQPSALLPPQPQPAVHFAPRASACEVPDGAGPVHPSWALPPAVLQRWRLREWGCSK